MQGAGPSNEIKLAMSLKTGITTCVQIVALYCYKSNVILMDKSSKDSVFITDGKIKHLCKYIYNVSHNSLNCLMIGAAMKL